MVNTDDKAEIVKTEIWKNNSKFSIYAVYSLPNNMPNLATLTLSNKTIVIDDLNAHSPRWNYTNYNAAGKEVEGLLNSTTLELIFSPSDSPPYLHYNGKQTQTSYLCRVTLAIKQLVL